MIYDIVCNTLKDLNPYALPLDDVARLQMPNLMELAKKYRRGFINNYEYLKSVCNIMEYDTDCIKGFFVYDDGNNIMNVYYSEDEADEAIDVMVEDDEYIGQHHTYTIIERR